MPSRITTLEKEDSSRSKGMTPQRQSANNNSTTERRKLVVIGDGAVGKTCLLYSYTKQPFDENYLPTVFDNHVTELSLPHNPREPTKNIRNLELALWDTAGQEDYDRLRPLSYPDTDVLLFCFSVDSQRSLEHIQRRWYPEAEHFLPGVPKVLVGLKADLREGSATGSNKRTNPLVRMEDAQDVAFKVGASAYVECSARTRAGVDGVIERAIRSVWEKEREETKFKRRLAFKRCCIA